jgi:hypothetical protein
LLICRKTAVPDFLIFLLYVTSKIYHVWGSFVFAAISLRLRLCVGSTLNIKGTVFWGVHLVARRKPDIVEEHVTAISLVISIKRWQAELL